ncbi:uncharacterized protein LOC135493630 [Lineus longissimus]|uniref:uncharacterized protein LOC135493630 n=1 Tax=Lineus longissimus TaxID=88925 RepID=UPI00315DF864
MDIFQTDIRAAAVRRMTALRVNVLRVGHDHREILDLLPLLDSVLTEVQNMGERQAESNNREADAQQDDVADDDTDADTGDNGGAAVGGARGEAGVDPSNTSRSSRRTGFHAPRVSDGSVGSSSYHIPRTQLEYLFHANFPAPRIASIMQVSVATIRRRLRSYRLSYRQRQSTISDEDLDDNVRTICAGNRRIGYRLVQARLDSAEIRVTRERVRQSMLRVDPVSVALCWCQTIRRRSYHVSGPNSLWHIDGNHKLIRWGFVIHGGIDGFSRLMVFLSVAYNNRASTVLSSFVTAADTYGVPSRVRADRGGENNLVEEFMNTFRGNNRGSMIRGRSGSYPHVNELFCDPGTDVEISQEDVESYGIDWDGPRPDDDDDDVGGNATQTVTVVESETPFSREDFILLQQTISPLQNSIDTFGIDIYLSVLNFMGEHGLVI